MGQTKIRVFKGLRDGKEDPNEFIEDLEWAYDQDYKSKEPRPSASNNHEANDVAVQEFRNRTHRILFRQHVSDSAWDWYSDLDPEVKTNWPSLKRLFLPAFEVTVKDSQTKKFELRVKLHNLEQLEDENIAEYLKKASELAMKLPTDDIDVGMATLKGMRDLGKRERVSFECNKDHDYSFTTVQRLVRAAYSEVGKLTPFDPGYKDAMKITLPGIPASANTDDLLRQLLINTNQAIPALVHGMRAMNTNQPKSITNHVQERYPSKNRDRQPRDLSSIKCYKCEEYGHYASRCPQNTPPEVTAGVFPQLSQQEEDENEELWRQYREKPTPARCLLLAGGTSSMAAARKDGDQAPSKILQRPAGIRKNVRPTPYNPPQLPQNILDQIEAFNQSQGRISGQQDEEMEEDDFTPARSSNSPQTTGRPSQAHESPATTSGNASHPPLTRVSRTDKVQELVTMKGPKLPDAIRGMVNRPRFDIGSIMDIPVQISLGELLDRSDSTIKELAYNMQRATPRYRVRKAADKAPGHAVLAASAILPPPVTANAFEDDGESKPVMITSWVHSLRLPRTLLDGGSLVELINEKRVNAIRPRPTIHTDGYLRVSLATDKLDTLTNYVCIPVNVEGVEAIIKAWVVQVDIYDLLLGLTWMRRVHCNPHYGIGKITIAGDDRQTREVPGQLVAMEAGLPTVEFEEEDYDSADYACQQLLDEQENAMP